jgi:hypothetical protein
MIVWHYTTHALLDSILVDGLISPATEGVDYQLSGATKATLEQIIATGRPQSVSMELASGEMPAIWFSKRPTWEPTASKGLVERGRQRSATIAEMVARHGGLARIGVDAAGLLTWLDHRKLSGISAADAKRLVRSAVMVGANPGDWFVSYGTVRRERWLAIEESVDGVTWSRVVESRSR